MLFTHDMAARVKQPAKAAVTTEQPTPNVNMQMGGPWRPYGSFPALYGQPPNFDWALSDEASMCTFPRVHYPYHDHRTEKPAYHSGMANYYERQFYR